MTQYAELIERLENATGPDRELDGLIYGLLEGLERNGGTFQIGEKFQFKHPTLMHPSGPAALYIPDAAVLEYTASIDAALTLVPQTYTTSVHSDFDEVLPTGIKLESFAPDRHEAEVVYFSTWNVEPPPLGVGYSVKLPIALCIAALKAREATP